MIYINRVKNRIIRVSRNEPSYFLMNFLYVHLDALIKLGINPITFFHIQL